MFKGRSVAPVAVTTVEAMSGLPEAIDAAAALERPDRQFLTRSWFAAPGGEDARTLIVRSQDGVALAAIPTVARRSGIRQVPGAYWPFRSFPVAEDVTADGLVTALMSRAARCALGRVWRLGPVYADDPAVALLTRAAERAGWTLLVRRLSTSFAVPLLSAGSPAFPRASTLKKNRFHEKHLADHGVPCWETLRGADWTSAAFDALAQVEAKSWQGASRDAKFLGPAHRRIWERLARDPAQAGRMCGLLLRIDGVPAAYAFNIDSGATRYGISIGYDPAIGKQSPGRLVFWRDVIDALTRGINRIDLGMGDAGYKAGLGAEPASEIIDLLVMHGRIGRIVSALIGPLWRRSGQASASHAPAAPASAAASAVAA